MRGPKTGSSFTHCVLIENHLYYQQLEVALGADTIDAKLQMYEELSEKYPKAQTPLRLPLNIGKG